MHSKLENRGPFEKDLRGADYQDLLIRLQGKSPFFKQFRDWGEVLTFMRSGTSQDPAKDEVLQPICMAFSRENDPRWQDILLAIFGPGLHSLRLQRKAWDQDGNDLWQNIVLIFFQKIRRMDLGKRSTRLVQKIFNDTAKGLHRQYLQIWRRKKGENLYPPEEVEAMVGGIHDLELDLIDHREKQQETISCLQKHLDADRISKADFFLLVGTRVYGRPLIIFAREHGLDYQAAKKRRNRAEAVLHQSEKENEKNQKIVSPDLAPTALCSSRGDQRQGQR